MPALTQPAIGSTSWGTDMNNNLKALQTQLTNAMQGRLVLNSTTKILLSQYTGDTIEVNGLNVSMGASGIALNTTDNLITSTGADSGGAMAASTLYYVYVSNSSASPFASSLRASTTAPSVLNGVKYLGTSGNAANWRFVGYVRTNGSTQFVSSETQRFVINYYNRRPLSLRVVETADSWTYTTLTWHPWNANTANRVEFIANGEDSVFLIFNCMVQNNSGSAVWMSCGIGLDSTSGTATASFFTGAITWGFRVEAMTAVYSEATAEGYHYLQLLEISQAAGTTSWFGDSGLTFQSAGAAGFVMG